MHRCTGTLNRERNAKWGSSVVHRFIGSPFGIGAFLFRSTLTRWTFPPRPFDLGRFSGGVSVNPLNPLNFVLCSPRQPTNGPRTKDAITNCEPMKDEREVTRMAPDGAGLWVCRAPTNQVGRPVRAYPRFLTVRQARLPDSESPLQGLSFLQPICFSRGGAGAACPGLSG